MENVKKIELIRDQEKEYHEWCYDKYTLFEEGSWLHKPVQTVMDLIPLLDGQRNLSVLDLGPILSTRFNLFPFFMSTLGFPHSSCNKTKSTCKLAACEVRSMVNVWQLVNHITFWNEYILQRMRGVTEANAEIDNEQTCGEPRNPMEDSAWQQTMDRAESCTHTNSMDRLKYLCTAILG